MRRLPRCTPAGCWRPTQRRGLRGSSACARRSRRRSCCRCCRWGLPGMGGVPGGRPGARAQAGGIRGAQSFPHSTARRAFPRPCSIHTTCVVLRLPASHPASRSAPPGSALAGRPGAAPPPPQPAAPARSPALLHHAPSGPLSCPARRPQRHAPDFCVVYLESALELGIASPHDFHDLLLMQYMQMALEEEAGNGDRCGAPRVAAAWRRMAPAMCVGGTGRGAARAAC